MRVLVHPDITTSVRAAVDLLCALSVRLRRVRAKGMLAWPSGVECTECHFLYSFRRTSPQRAASGTRLTSRGRARRARGEGFFRSDRWHVAVTYLSRRTTLYMHRISERQEHPMHPVGHRYCTRRDSGYRIESIHGAQSATSDIFTPHVRLHSSSGHAFLLRQLPAGGREVGPRRHTRLRRLGKAMSAHWASGP